ncbi:hypothetical protein BWQ96_07784 [Gracilariopsis chorda]|uniref:Uncharacterized protein n=1 Tax=Gracilariopsis chorda TaxID=448386 RepID=A0A2V3IKB4_9FLOR|nr:hypothetical protein BWQ96_07784 [Gracilariopsis chorda]|eukprot:PXF42522.1 hypothetical protein BWQ96_07784 [Gracilariopsis chorda]
MDSIDSVENALDADTIQHRAVMLKRMEAYKMVAAIESDGIAVNDALKSIEHQWNVVSPEEREQLEKDAVMVMELLLESGRGAFDVSVMANTVYKGSRQVSQLRAAAIQSHERLNQATQKLEEEQEKADGKNSPCTACAQLQGDVKEFKKEVKDASKLAGEAARGNREHNHKAIEDMKKIEEQRSMSAEAKERVLAKVSSVLKRAGNQ